MKAGLAYPSCEVRVVSVKEGKGVSRAGVNLRDEVFPLVLGVYYLTKIYSANRGF